METPTPPRVLVAEDDPHHAGLLDMALKSAGWSVRLCEDGVQALVALGQDVPDAIVLDYRLPGGDGLQVLRRLRQNPRTQRVPVIMYSDDPEARAGLGQAPGTVLVTKSAGLGALMSRVATIASHARHS